MTSKTGKRTLWAVVVAVAVGMIIAVYHTTDLLVAYHTWCLRRDPELIHDWRTAPENSIKRLSMQKFFASTFGQRLLRQRIVHELFQLLEQQKPEFLPRALDDGQILQASLYTSDIGPWCLVDGPTTAVLKTRDSVSLRDYEPFYEFVSDGTFELGEHPGVLFEMWACKTNDAKTPSGVEIRLVNG